ncbi:hypothetical protein L7F22_023541 [Adiantum nelumboides]|nr:hypothetical protein [Adiantum nelumboides]
MRRGRLILHYHLHWHSHKKSTCSSTFAHHKHTTAKASLCRQGRSNQRVLQNENAFSETLLISATCQQQRTSNYCHLERHPPSCGEDNALRVSKPASTLVHLTVGKPGQKQKLEGHDSVKKSGECHSGSVKDCASVTGPCSEDNANTFECVTHRRYTEDHLHHGIVRGFPSSMSSGDFPELSPTSGEGEQLNLDCPELSEFGASETLCTSKGNDCQLLVSTSPNPSSLADQRCCSQPLLRAAKSSEGFELLRKTELLEQLSPNGAANLLQIGAVMRCSFEQLEAVIGLLKNYFATDERVVKVLVMNKRVLLHPVGLLEQKLKLLTLYKIEKETLDRISSYTSVLSMSIEALEEKLVLLEDIGLNAEAKNKALCAGPAILSMSVQNTVKIVNFLKTIAATRQRLSAVVRTQPCVLCMSFENNLLPKYKFLEQIGICAEKIPFVLAFSSRSTMDRIKLNMQFFKDMGFSAGDFCVILEKQPSIIGRSSKTMKLTVDYLVYEMGWSKADIISFPKCLGLGLKSRIIPRCNIAMEYGLSNVFSLGTILGYGDSRFKELLNSKKLARN